MKELEDLSYSFYCNDLNLFKYALLYNKALDLRKFKNDISNLVCLNFSKYINMTKIDWINEFRTTIHSCNNQDISNAISDVFTSYDNKRDKFFEKIDVKIQDYIKTEYYKKNTKLFKKGDVKSTDIKFKSTKLTNTVKFLVKYYHTGLIDYMKTSDKDYTQILNHIDKYGQRLINLVISKRELIKSNIFNHPILFESLSFRSCTEQKQNIINKSKRTGSIYNTVITLPGQNINGGKINIPVKHSLWYHGSLKDYYKTPNKKGQINNSYTICFENNKIRIVLSKKVMVTKIIDKTNYYGVDVNVKHNLFCDKHGKTIDYNRQMFNDYVKFLKKLDNKRSKRSTEDKNKISNRDRREKNRWMVRIKGMLKEKSSLLVKQAKELGMDHLVLEDLGSMGRSFTRNDEFDGFKYSRLIKLLNLTDIKNILESICEKNGLQSSFIHAPYTSSGCDKCGYSGKENRKTQEEFKCVSCGHEDHADTHSSKMIEDRMEVDVLRNSLMTYKNGKYKPKKVSRPFIKNILLDCYGNIS